MKKKTIKWTLGVIGLIILGAIGSGLWQVGIQPIFEWISERVLSLTALGFSSLSEAFYRDLAKGFHEESSLLTLWNVQLILFVGFGAYLGSILGDTLVSSHEKRWNNIIEKYNKLTPDTEPALIQEIRSDYHKYIETLKRSQRNYKRYFRICIIFAVFFLSFIYFRAWTVDLRNKRITGFRQTFTLAKPFLNEQEEEAILANFAAIQNRQDYLKVIKKLTDKFLEQVEALKNSSNTQKKTK